MAVLFSQHWDVAIKKHDQYSNFIMTRYNPKMASLGLPVVGGYYVAVGEGPRIIAVSATEDLKGVEKALDTEEYQALNSELMAYVAKYHSKILVPTGRVRMENYSIGRGVWKFNQYWNIVPGAEAEYTSYVADEYLPAMESVGLKVAGGWRVIVGSGPYIISESSAPNIVDIARAIDTPEYRRVVRKLKTNYVTDYQSKILAPTGRIEIPFFMEEMMKGF